MTFSRVSDKLIYEGALTYFQDENSFCYEPFRGSDYTLMLGCAYLRLDISVNTNEIINVSGFCPNDIWIPKTLVLPDNVTVGSVKIHNDEELLRGTGDWLFEGFSFINNVVPIYYDKTTNWCCITKTENTIPDENIEFARNCILSLSKGEFVALWLKPEYQ